MKKILTMLLLVLSINIFAGTISVSVGLGTESIIKPKEIEVKLIEERLSYQFNNGIITGIIRMDGTPNIGLAQIRNDVMIGYGRRFDNINPYIILSKGQLIMGGENYKSFTTIIGSGIKLTENIFGTLQYRHRHDERIEWITDRYQVGTGYNFTKNINVSVNYGKSFGTYRGFNYESDQTAILGTYKF